MIKLKLTLLLIAVSLFSLSSEAQERNLLTSRYDISFLKENIQNRESYRPFPAAGNEIWKQVLPEDFREEIITEAETLLDFEYPVLKASLYLDFVRNGNRSRFQRVYSKRRSVVETLIMAEILENKSRFMDDIVNGIWAMCEETSWVLPAHIGEQDAGSGLPDITEPLTAILSSETPSLFAAAEYFLGDRLDKVNPLIRERMKYEVKRQFLDVMLERKDIWWMGYTERIPNNWNPWVISNYINTLLIFEDDPERKAQGLYIAMDMLDNFLNPYPADGGCDEGPAYWNHAGGRVYNCLDQLYRASDGKINIYNEELIRNIGDYIWKAWINNGWYVNFADAPASLRPDYGLIYRYGKSTGSDQMMAFARMLRDQRDEPDFRTHYLMLRALPDMLVEEELSGYEGKFIIEDYINLPDLQVSFVRQNNTANQGLFLAVKGGHNNESHNHNDAGNFILYNDGQPLIVDAGVGEYTRKTFSSERYDIWTMQSSYHNLPDVNRTSQRDGERYRAKNFNSYERGNKVLVNMELAEAYPLDANLNSYKRSLELNRKKSQLTLQDRFEFNDNENNLKFNFLTNHIPKVEEGNVVLHEPESGKTVAEIEQDSNLAVIVEEILIDDRRLSGVWGEKLYRVSFEKSIFGLSEVFKFEIKTFK